MAQLLFDGESQRYFYYDAPFDQFVYRDGTRSRRPSARPRSLYLQQPEETLPPLFYSNERQQRFRFDRELDRLVFEDGSSVPRPANAPRSMFQRGQQHAPPAVDHRQSIAGTQPAVDQVADRLQSTRIDAPASLPLHAPTSEYQWNGFGVVDARDPASQVRTFFATAPSAGITDPDLFGHGARAHRMLLETAGETEYLYPSFRLRREEFFQVGRVFLTLWAEPAGPGVQTAVTQLERSDARLPPRDPNNLPGRFRDEYVYSKVRRFVVVRCAERYCSAVPIMTYGKQGVAKAGVTKSEHGVIYTGPAAPPPKRDELPRRGEEGMRAIPIRVVPDSRADTLDDMSRIDYGKIHSIHYNVKARSFGLVHPDSVQPLQSQFYNVILPGSPFSAVMGSGPRMPGTMAGGSQPGRSSAHSAGSQTSRGGANRSAPYPITAGPATTSGSRETEDNDDSDSSGSAATVIREAPSVRSGGSQPRRLPSREPSTRSPRQETRQPSSVLSPAEPNYVYTPIVANHPQSVSTGIPDSQLTTRNPPSSQNLSMNSATRATLPGTARGASLANVAGQQAPSSDTRTGRSPAAVPVGGASAVSVGSQHSTRSQISNSEANRGRLPAQTALSPRSTAAHPQAPQRDAGRSATQNSIPVSTSSAPQSAPRREISGPTSTHTLASSAQAAQPGVSAAMAQLQSQGLSRQQAFDQLVVRMHASNPTWTREQITAHVRAQL